MWLNSYETRRYIKDTCRCEVDFAMRRFSYILWLSQHLKFCMFCIFTLKKVFCCSRKCNNVKPFQTIFILHPTLLCYCIKIFSSAKPIKTFLMHCVLDKFDIRVTVIQARFGCFFSQALHCLYILYKCLSCTTSIFPHKKCHTFLKHHLYFIERMGFLYCSTSIFHKKNVIPLLNNINVS